MTKVSMNLPSSFFAFLTVIIPIVTIGSTYFIAEAMGHVPKWPDTDITHCAIHMPENVIFKIGLIVTCVIMAWCWYVAYSWIIIQEKIQKKKLSKKEDDSDACCSGFMSCGPEPHAMLTLGIFGCFLLTLSTATITTDNMPWTIHVIGATGFFILTFIAQIILTLKVHVLRANNKKFVSKLSLAMKYACLGFSFVSLLLNLLAQLFKLPSGYSNAGEWFFALGILSYNSTLLGDWNKKVFTSVTETEEEEEDEEEDEEEQAVMIKKRKKGKKVFKNPEEMREVMTRSNEIERMYRTQAMAPPMEHVAPAPAFNPALLAHHQQQVYAPMYFAPAEAMPVGLYPMVPPQYQASNNH